MKRILFLALIVVGCGSDPVAPTPDPELSKSDKITAFLSTDTIEIDTKKVRSSATHTFTASCERYKSKGFGFQIRFSSPLLVDAESHGTLVGGSIKYVYDYDTPPHRNQMPGIYRVSYTVTRQMSSDTAVLTGYIRVK